VAGQQNAPTLRGKRKPLRATMLRTAAKARAATYPNSRYYRGRLRGAVSPDKLKPHCLFGSCYLLHYRR